MENKEILKKCIEQFNLKDAKYFFCESVLIEEGFVEWLYFKLKGYTFCISCSYNPKFPKKHEYVFSRIDDYGRENFIYNGFSKRKMLQMVKENI